jgi:uncharacterized lipoprotein YddW (UPF0748 family)
MPLKQVVAASAICVMAFVAGCNPKAVRRAAAFAPTATGLAALPVPQGPPATFNEKEEMRAGWVVGWRQMVSTSAIDEAIDLAQTARLNTLFVQVRVSGDAYYRSDFVPRAQILKDQPPDFDPLDYALHRAHERGIAVHAWVNMGILWRSTTAPTDPRHVFNAHPDWIMRDATGKLAYPDTKDPTPGFAEENYWINWSHPEAQDHLVRVVSEIVDRYPVDGVHFDFVRYPARMGPRTAGVGYDPVSLARFRAETGQEPAEHTKAWDSWRLEQITRVLTRCREEVKRRRPQASVSAAVLGAWNLAYGRNSTDYRGWLETGVLDFAALMAYYDKPDWVWQSVINARERAAGHRILLGLGLSSISPEVAAGQILLSREQDLLGFSLFSLDNQELKDSKSYLAHLRDLAIPDVHDDRYSQNEPLWNRVGVVDPAHRAFSLRFYSRRGHTKMVVYPKGITSLLVAINDQALAPFMANGLTPIQVDLSPWLDPFAREVAANHDFVMTASAEGPPESAAQIFTVDYYEPPVEISTASIQGPQKIR